MKGRGPLCWILALAGAAVLGVVLLATVVMVAMAASGALTTPPGAWVVQMEPLPGLRLRASVPGLVRFATAPTALRLLDGRAVSTRRGRLRFERDGHALVVICAPCRIDDARIAAETFHIEQVRLRLEQFEAQKLRGDIRVGEVIVSFTAALSPDRIDIDWQLPSTPVADLYRTLANVILEAQVVRIDGTFEARGNLRLPQRRARAALAIKGFGVDGLDMAKLAAGPVAFDCRDSHGLPVRRTLVPGEGRWISPSGSGALLAAAVLAAEDQRFFEHDGLDRAEIAQVLASIEELGPTRGASTVTQQLARTLFTGHERTAARKLRELLYAVAMERTLGKRAILALYLNSIDWGPGVCGADAAARIYFGKRPQQLTPLEAAWLASILPNPSRAYEEEFLTGTADTVRAARVLQQMRTLPRKERERQVLRQLTFAAPPRTTAPASWLAATPQ